MSRRRRTTTGLLLSGALALGLLAAGPAGTAAAQAAAPTVDGVAPQSQEAGRTATVTLSGSGFAPGAVVTFERQVLGLPPRTEAVRASTVEVRSPSVAVATVTFPADAATGPRTVRLTNTDQASGTCQDCYTIEPAGASPSPSPSVQTPPSPSPAASPSPSPSVSLSPSPSPSAPTSAPAPASPSPSAAPSPSRSSLPAPAAPTLTLPRSTITSQEAAVVRGTAEPGSVVELHAYSRPNVRYSVVREVEVTTSGRVQFLVTPSGNTRMFLRQRDPDGARQVDSASVVLTVRTGINLKVLRTAPLTYRFSGSTLPRRSGQLVTVFLQPDGGSRVIAARARVAPDGTYVVTRRFTGRGTFTLFTGTGRDIDNAAGTSNRVRTTLR